ncbi:MAG: hypothetical protein ACEQSQ_00040 [Candidatus Paceibacteria bacterium]
MSLKIEITNQHLDAVADIVANKLLNGEVVSKSINAVTGLVDNDKGVTVFSSAFKKCGMQLVAAETIANHLMEKHK